MIGSLLNLLDGVKQGKHQSDANDDTDPHVNVAVVPLELEGGESPLAIFFVDAFAEKPVR